MGATGDCDSTDATSPAPTSESDTGEAEGDSDSTGGHSPHPVGQAGR